MSEYERCLKIAKEQHKSQRRRYSDEPYFNHVKRVSDSFDDEFLRCIALLHDVIEDTKITAQQLSAKGIDWNIIRVVKVLTREKNEDYLSYIRRVSRNSFAVKVKLADLIDNMSDLKEGDKKDKYRLAEYILSEHIVKIIEVDEFE